MKILVYLPRTLGASLLAFPCLKSLEQNFPAAEISILPSAAYADFFQNVSPGYKVIRLPDFKDIAGLKRASARLKKMNFDLGLLLDESFASALLFYLARIPQRWGYDREGRGFMLTKKSRLRATDPQLHLKHHYLQLPARLGLKVADQPLRLSLPDSYRKSAAGRLRHSGLNPERATVVIKPGSSFGPARIWPLDQQKELVRRLLESRLQVVLVGSSNGQAITRGLLEELGDRVVDFSGQLSLEETAGVIAGARVYLGNDCGLTHLANLLGTPVVGLYGPSDPHLCGPSQPPAAVLHKSAPCAPCSYRACPYDHRCLSNISAGEVYEVISSFLAR
ncbi:MAG: lipopolysaccharide heptosyltransferase II [Candidatus Saccharicenans sp.]|nr:lipopolysaccharide heptosyltransferase II [Candidatus Saccharicenans sp.]